MQRRQFLSFLAAPACLGPVACIFNGCGTLVHNERVGQPHSPQIDWKIAALDGLGLLLFFVPGVVAFVVDFYTGAIYLPYEECYLPYELPSDGTGGRAGVVPPNAPGFPQENLPRPSPSTLPMLQPADTAPQIAPPLEPQATLPGSAPASFNVGPRLDAHLPPPQVGMRRILVPREHLRPQGLERVVSRHVGRQISLDEQQARLSVLPRLDQFCEQRRRHESDRQFGFAVQRFFERFRCA